MSDERTEREQAAELADGIAAAWDQLAELEDAGTLSPAQMRWLTRQEPDDEALLQPVRARLWLATLNRAVIDPKAVGVNLEAMGSAPYTCPCGDTGLVEQEGAFRPCERCNPSGYVMWRDHWRLGPKHSCARCARPRRGAAPEPQAERRPTGPDREAEAAATRASLA